jgi:tetratricopeptide (TPR) repeat protein
MAPRISLCMIARDQAEHVAACLRTIADLVFESVLVEAESFAESIRRARGEWIFWLDAHDRVPDASRAELAALFEALDPNAGYLLRSVSPGVREERQLRIFPNDARHAQGALALVDTGIVVLHNGYEDPAAVNERLEGVDIDDCVLAFHRAAALLDLGRASEALAAFRRCERRLRGTPFGQPLPIFKVRAHVQEGRLADALAEVRAGLTHEPGDAALALMESELLAALGQLEEAEQRLSEQLAAPGGAIARARNLMAEVLLVRGRAEQAERVARRVVEERPSFALAWLTLGEALLLQGKRRDLAEVRARLAHASLAAFDAIEASSRGDHDLALALIDRALPAVPDDAVLLRTRAAVIDARDGRGREVDAAVAEALASAPLCVRTRAIARRVTR